MHDCNSNVHENHTILSPFPFLTTLNCGSIQPSGHNSLWNINFVPLAAYNSPSSDDNVHGLHCLEYHSDSRVYNTEGLGTRLSHAFYQVFCSISFLPGKYFLSITHKYIALTNKLHIDTNTVRIHSLFLGKRPLIASQYNSKCMESVTVNSGY